MVRVMTLRALRQLCDGTERAGWPEQPVLLWGSGRHRRRQEETPPPGGLTNARSHRPAPAPDEIHLILNGRPATLRGTRGKTLLRALREDAGLTGTKEGCAEGECGACTVWLDGVAVMSCLVPAERAEGCEVTTVEGLAQLGVDARAAVPRRSGHSGEAGGERLHPLQQAFIDAAAVQCGYCTPGLLMSAANLLQEVNQPDGAQIREALTGNLCRCTGYYSILRAVEKAVGR
jgi:carbon-monoxide dehydrogenase medium subunit